MPSMRAIWASSFWRRLKSCRLRPALWAASAGLRRALTLSTKSSPAGSTADTKPAAKACDGDIRAPKRRSSLARDGPRISGKVTELQNSGVTHKSVNGHQKYVESAAMTMSQCGSTVQPTPTAGPFTAATMGLGKRITALMKRPTGSCKLPWRDLSGPTEGSKPASRSAPVQKNLPSPVSKTTLTAESASAARRASIQPS
mmetsp:Transcript_19076/g.48228  ORF Transcript_19076/g.48228 Transcript_19076/m.48228 type:complete len:200 (-) Transcript_19076:245-844(-)